MTLATFMLYFFEAIAALSALALALVRNVFYGALLLIVCLLCLAGIYVLAFAEFVAVTQILIYAGGILVVIIFGIMLTTRISEKPLNVEHGNLFSGLLAAIGCFGLLVYVFTKESFIIEPAASIQVERLSHVNKIGISLMTTYMLPFEIAGLLLLIALVAAAVIASTSKTKSDVPH
jgi:NADH:ubiquinone oxidoreductase subunit 6 (subunit J)